MTPLTMRPNKLVCSEPLLTFAINACADLSGATVGSALTLKYSDEKVEQHCHEVDQLLTDGFTPVAVDVRTKRIVGAVLSHVYER